MSRTMGPKKINVEFPLTLPKKLGSVGRSVINSFFFSVLVLHSLCIKAQTNSVLFICLLNLLHGGLDPSIEPSVPFWCYRNIAIRVGAGEGVMVTWHRLLESSVGVCYKYKHWTLLNVYNVLWLEWFVIFMVQFSLDSHTLSLIF